jgi:putative hydrolase of the HAD superfamily
MTLPRWIIFDYGNVLDIPDDWEAWWAHTNALAARHALTGKELWKLLFTTDAWQQVKVGKITEAQYWEVVLLPLGYASPESRDEFAREFFHGRDRVDPRMALLLRELQPRFRLAILSNTQIVDMERWLVEARGMAGIFDEVISSAAVGLAKPDRAIYEYTVQKLNIAPDEGLFIDDLLRNTSVAEAVGLPCIVFENPDQLRRELALRGILTSVPS